MAFIARDLGDFVGERGRLVEAVGQPLAGESSRKLEADALTEDQHLSVVAEH